MSNQPPLTPIQTLEMFKESHPDLNSIEKILEFSEDDFVKEFTGREPFNGDIRKARQAYRAAQRIQEQIPLLWANLREIGSPVLKNALFNNIPESFIEHFNSIPAYNKLFGNLDYTETDHSRSILGPAAYYVDLLRFIERNITNPKKNPNIPAGHRLEERQPRLFRIPLDKDNTYTLVPYIDLVNEVLEDIVRDPAQPDKSPYQILEKAHFPMQLPFHLPLEEVRLYLKQLKTSLQEIYRLFSYIGQDVFTDLPSEDGEVLTSKDSQSIYQLLQDQYIIDYQGRLTEAFQSKKSNLNLKPANSERDYSNFKDQIIEKLSYYQGLEIEISREILALSPREYKLIENEIEKEHELKKVYGFNDEDDRSNFNLLASGKGTLEDVETFIEKTGLTHPQLNELLFLDLSNDEINAGLARLQFINNTGESQANISIEPNFEQNLLFSINDVKNYINELDQRILSPELKKEFENQNHDYLSTEISEIKVLVDVLVASRSWKWLVKDASRTFILQYIGTEFAIYEGSTLRFQITSTPITLGEKQINAESLIKNFRVPENSSKITKELKQDIKQIFAGNAIPLSDGFDITEWKTEKWRISDSKKDKSYVVRHNVNKLEVFDAPYDRLANLTLKRLDRIYRFLKLSRKLGWSFADLDLALRSLQKTPLGEKVLLFDGVNDFISIPSVKGDINNLDSFTLEAWVQLTNTTNNPILAKGSPDGSLTQFMLWVTPQGKLAFFSNLNLSFNPEAKPHSKNPNLQSWGSQLASPKDDGTAWFNEKNGKLVAVNIHDIPSADLVDRKQHGIVLMSNGQVSLDTFTHIAITINETSEILVDESTDSNGSAKKQTFYQLKFYINGSLDSTWSLKQKLPLSFPDNQPIDINIGRNLLNEYFSGCITDVKLWATIRAEEELANHRFQRCSGLENNLLAYWPLVQNPDLLVRRLPDRQLPSDPIQPADLDFQVRDLAIADFSGNPKPRYDGRFGLSTPSSDGTQRLALSPYDAPNWVTGDLALDPLPAPLSIYAYHFNGLDEYVGGQVQGLNLNPLTLEAWVTIDQSRIHPLLCLVEVKNQRINTIYKLWIDETNHLVLTALIPETPGTPVLKKFISTQTISENQPTHVAAILNGTTVHFSINAAALEQSTGLNSDHESLLDLDLEDCNLLYLGHDFGANYLKGTLQEVRIWGIDRTEPDRTEPDRTTTKLRENRYHQLTGSEPGLEGYWRLEDPDPTQIEFVRDRTFNKNNLYPGGIPELYQPKVETHPEVILPDPVASTSLALTFAQNQYPIVIANKQRRGLGYPEQFTLQFWFKPQAPIDTQKKQILFSQGDEDTGLSIYLFEGKLYTFAWSASFGGKPIESHIKLEHDAIDEKRWQHLTFTYDETAEQELFFFSHNSQTSANTPEKLNQHELPTELCEQFERNNIPLSAETAIKIYVNRKNLEWRIRDYVLGKTYLIRLGKRLHLGERRFTIYEITPNTQEIAYRLYINDELRDEQKTDTGIRLDQIGEAYLGGLSREQPFTRFHTDDKNNPPQSLAESYPFSGQITDFRLWHIAIPAEQITFPASKQHPRHIPPDLNDDNLVCYLPLTEGYGRSVTERQGPRFETEDQGLGPTIPDQSPHQLHGKLSVGPDTPHWTNAPDLPIFRDTVLKLNGKDQYLRLPYAAELNLVSPVDHSAQDFTLETWIRVESFGSEMPIVGSHRPYHPHPHPNHDFYLLLTETGQVKAGFGEEDLIASESLKAGQWHHIAWRFAKQTQNGHGQQTLWIDGVLKQSAEPSLGLHTDLPLYLGYRREEDDCGQISKHYFQGEISELRFWNTARSDAEIHNNYNRILSRQDLSGQEEHLQAYWVFDQDPRFLLCDRSSAAHHAPLVISPNTTIDNKWDGDEKKTAFSSEYLALNLNPDLNKPIDFLDLSPYTIPDAGTLELWVKFCRDRDQVLFDASGSDSQFLIDIEDGKLRFRVHITEAVTLATQINLRHIRPNFDSQFHHIAATWQFAPEQQTLSIQLFLDGIEKSWDKTDQCGSKPKLQTPFVGLTRSVVQLNSSEEVHLARPFQGQISQLRLWDSVLPLDQLNRLRYADLEGAEAGLQLYLPFKDKKTETCNAVVNTAIASVSLKRIPVEAEPPPVEAENPPWKWVPVDKAIELDGIDDFIELPHYKPTHSGTIELWVKHISRDRNQILLDASNNEPQDEPLQQKFFLLAIHEQKLRFGLEDEQDFNFQVEIDLSGDRYAHFDDQWHHIVATWEYDPDRNTVEAQLYLDGEGVAVKAPEEAQNRPRHFLHKWLVPGRSGVEPAFKSLFVGKSRGYYPWPIDFGTAGLPLSGKIGQIRIWSYVRTEEALRIWRDVPLNGTEKDLLVYLPIEEGKGTRLDNRVDSTQPAIFMVGSDLCPETDPVLRKWHDVDNALNLNDPETFIDLPEYVPTIQGSIELWGKFLRIREQILFDASDDCGNVFILEVDDKARLRFRLSDDNHDCAKLDLTELPNFNAGWHYVVATWYYDTPTQTLTTHLYLDGQYQATHARQQTWNCASLRNLHVGIHCGYKDTVWDYKAFKGQISQLRIWNRALHANELQALRYTQFQEAPPQLLMDLPIDEGEGSILRNRFGASNAIVKQGVVAKPEWVETNKPLFKFHQDFAVLPQTKTLQIQSQSFTIEALINIQDFTEERPILGIRGPRDPQSLASEQWVVSVNPERQLQVRVQGRTLLNNKIKLNAEQWYHVICRYDHRDRNLSVWVLKWPHAEIHRHPDDRNLVASIYLTGWLRDREFPEVNPYEANRHLYIGHWRNWNETTNQWQEKYFQGFIDEVRIWNGVRTEAEIRKHRDRRLRGDESGLTGYWRSTGDYRRTLFSSQPNKLSPPLPLYIPGHLSADLFAPIRSSVRADYPPLHETRSVPALDGYNDYIELGRTFLDGHPHTVEFWFKPANSQQEWQHLALVYSGDGLRPTFGHRSPQGIYLNGSLTTDDQLAQAGLSDWLQVVRANEGYPAQFCNGLIAEVRLWAIALNQQAVQTNRYRSPKPWESHLWAYWKLNEKQGVELYDLTEALAAAKLEVGLEKQADKWKKEPPIIYDASSVLPSKKQAVSALYFDGKDDHIILDPLSSNNSEDHLDVSKLGLSNSFTVEAWIKLVKSPPAPQDSTLPPVITMPVLGSLPATEDPNQQVLCLGIQSGENLGVPAWQPFFSFGKDNTLKAEYTLVPEDKKRQSSGWHHIVWQYISPTKDNSATMRILVAGRQVAIKEDDPKKDDDNFAPFQCQGALCIGKGQTWDTDKPQYFEGGLGEVRIWQTARSDEEIQQYKNYRLPGSQQILKELIAYWIFDDRNRVVIPSQVAQKIGTEINTYELVMESDLNHDWEQPEWKTITDHPLQLHPLKQQAFSFDGRFKYLATDESNFTTQEFTFEAWVKVEDLQAPRPILWCGDCALETFGSTHFALSISTAGRLEFYAQQNAPVASSPDDLIPLDQFTHIAFSVQKQNATTRIALFINGEEVSNGTTNRSIEIASHVLQIGRGILNGTPAYFNGQIQEVRIWNSTKNSDDLKKYLYQSLDRALLKGQELQDQTSEDLLAYWPLSNREDTRASNRVQSAPDLNLGGLVYHRKPTTGTPTQFLDARRKVLTLPLSEDAPQKLHIPAFKEQTHLHRSQRTVEVWFQCENPFLAKQQILYREGDEVRGLSIYIKSGKIYFEGHNDPKDQKRQKGESNWTGSEIACDRIQASCWHHATLVLDGRAEIHDHAFRAFLDGRMIDTRPGSQIWGKGTVQGISIGGIQFFPSAEARKLKIAPEAKGSTLQAFWWKWYYKIQNEQPLKTELLDIWFISLAYYLIFRRTKGLQDKPFLHGQIKEIRVWETTRTTKEIYTHRFALPANPQGLLFHWETEQQQESDSLKLPDSIVAAMKVPAPMSTNASDPKIPLVNLAHLQELKADESIAKLATLWSDIQHTGKGDKRTLYDKVFNKNIPADPYWPYVQRLLWEVKPSTKENNTSGKGQDASQHQIRSRLISAVSGSSDKLDRMVNFIGLNGLKLQPNDLESEARDIGSVVLDGSYLAQLNRLKQLSSFIKLSIEDTIELLKLLRVEYQETLPLNGLDQFTIQDVVRIKARADWMHQSGINLYEYKYLTQDIRDSRVVLHYQAKTVIEQSLSLLNQARAYLLRPQGLTTEGIESASEQVYKKLKDGAKIEEVTLQPQTGSDAGINAVTLGVVKSNFQYFTEREEKQYLDAIAEYANWTDTFSKLELSWDVLRRKSFAIFPKSEAWVPAWEIDLNQGTVPEGVKVAFSNKGYPLGEVKAEDLIARGWLLKSTLKEVLPSYIIRSEDNQLKVYSNARTGELWLFSVDSDIAAQLNRQILPSELRAILALTDLKIELSEDSKITVLAQKWEIKHEVENKENKEFVVDYLIEYRDGLYKVSPTPQDEKFFNLRGAFHSQLNDGVLPNEFRNQFTSRNKILPPKLLISSKEWVILDPEKDKTYVLEDSQDKSFTISEITESLQTLFAIAANQELIDQLTRQSLPEELRKKFNEFIGESSLSQTLETATQKWEIKAKDKDREKTLTIEFKDGLYKVYEVGKAEKLLSLRGIFDSKLNDGDLPGEFSEQLKAKNHENLGKPVAKQWRIKDPEQCQTYTVEHLDSNQLQIGKVEVIAKALPPKFTLAFESSLNQQTLRPELKAIFSSNLTNESDPASKADIEKVFQSPYITIDEWEIVSEQRAFTIKKTIGINGDEFIALAGWLDQLGRVLLEKQYLFELALSDQYQLNQGNVEKLRLKVKELHKKLLDKDHPTESDEETQKEPNAEVTSIQVEVVKQLRITDSDSIYPEYSIEYTKDGSFSVNKVSKFGKSFLFKIMPILDIFLDMGYFPNTLRSVFIRDGFALPATVKVEVDGNKKWLIKNPRKDDIETLFRIECDENGNFNVSREDQGENVSTDRQAEHLLTIDSTTALCLSSSKFDGALKAAFQKNGYPLSDDYNLVEEWLVTDKIQLNSYLIQKNQKQNQLDVFDLQTPDALSLEKLRKAFAGNPALNSDKLLEVRVALQKRLSLQQSLIPSIATTLKNLRQGLEATILTALADWLGTTPDLLKTLIENTEGKTYGSGDEQVSEDKRIGKIYALNMLEQLNEVATSGLLSPNSGLAIDLKNLSKILFLLSQFDLTDIEKESLLKQPELFGFQSLLKPQLANLNQLQTFVGLKEALNDSGDGLLKVVLGQTQSINEFTQWSDSDINTLTKSLNIAVEANKSILSLDLLSHAFRLVHDLGSNAPYLVDLANVPKLEETFDPIYSTDSGFEFYQRHAEILYKLVRAKFDDEQWPKAYKPLHDCHATLKRDCLTSVVMEKIADKITGRKSPDLLYEYLLLDVQTGSEVETSRIVQATAGLQLYIQRCLINLEKGITDNSIPQEDWDRTKKEWEWMKNYRVWEANRKVFLYPENYIEPELRDTKTPLFRQLEDELQQNDVNKDTVVEAYTHYLDKFAEVSNLTIVGSYLDKPKITSEEVIASESTLYLVGRNEATQEYYFRKLTDEKLWEPWEKIDLSINAKYISPVFAFNKLFLFWAEVQESVRVEDRKWVKNGNNGQPVDQIGNEIIVVNEGQDTTLTLPSGFALGKKAENGSIILNPNIQTKSQEGGGIKILKDTFVCVDKHGVIQQVNVKVNKPTIKYSYYNFSHVWTQPQTYKELDVELNEWKKRQPKWQRVYAQRWRESNVAPPVQRPSEKEDNVKVAQLGSNSSMETQLRDFEMDELTITFWLQVNLLKDAESETEPPTDTFSLFSFDGGQLEASLTHIPEPIGEMPQIMKGVEESDNLVRKFKAAIEAIQVFLGSPNPQNLTQLQSAGSEVDTQQSKTRQAKQSITNIDEPATLLCQRALDTVSVVQQARESTALLNPTSLTADQAADLADLLYQVTVSSLEIAKNALSISGQPLPDLDLAENHKKAAAQCRSDARTAANNVPPNLINATQQLNKTIEATINCLSEVVVITSNARTTEAQKKKWKRGNIKLQLNLGQTNPQDLLSIIEDKTWYHVALVLKHSSTMNKYIVTTYIHSQDNRSIIDGLLLEFSTDQLSKGQNFSIGKAGNPASTLPEGQYQPLMSEFRLWDLCQEKETIAQQHFQRLYPEKERLQAHIPLNGTESNTALVLVNSTLSLEQVFPLLIPKSNRERLFLLYGDEIYSLRNNLKDLGYQYEYIPEENAIDFYDLSLSTSNLPQIFQPFVGIDKTKRVISIENYASGKPSIFDRFQPEDRIVLLRDNPLEMKMEIDEWKKNSENEILLENNNSNDNVGNFYIEIAESYIQDVHNQPGWWILDIGDEIFLVRINILDKKLRTAESRLELEQNQATSTASGGGKFRLKYNREDNLLVQDNQANLLKYEFTRLNTFAINKLGEYLFGGGIDSLLSLNSQNSEEPNFDKIAKNSQKIIAPKYKFDKQTIDNRIDFDGAYGLYYQEIFFHIPFLIANQLNANQKFAEAQQWYHYIFNPTAQEDNTEIQHNSENHAKGKNHYWRYRPFQNLCLETLSEILSNADALRKYREDPFDPHTIARLRVNTYQKAVVMKYIDNLLDWGDYLFRQDTRESINEAIPLYVLAFNLLGSRPKAKPVRELEPMGTYHDIQADLQHNNHISELPDFLIPSGDRNLNHQVEIPFDPNRSVITRFSVPENTQFMDYWDRVEDRLYKIRHSLNLDGVFRALDLFQPPIDPAVMVRAVAGGGLAGGISAALASLNMPVPHYRYSFMLEKAKDINRQVIELGGALLQALEKRDAEELTILRHTHELNILNRTTEVKSLQIKEFETNLEALKASLANAQDKRKHYEQLINKGISKLEIAEISFLAAASLLRVIGTGINIASGVAKAYPEVLVGGSGFGGSPVFTVQYGGEQVSGVLDKVVSGLGMFADIASTGSQITGILANFERRKEDWDLQKIIAEHDIAQIEKQIAANAIQINIATRELQIHEQTIAQHKEVGDFYRNKFTNKELYTWMSSRLSGLYFQTYKLAFDLAKQAEKAFQFEFGTNETYIDFGYWDSRRKGLLAGEALRLDLARMEKAALDQHKRHLEITKHISLARLDPLALLQFKQSGRCQFSLSELLFDRDYPGHYFRIIKSISISIPAVIGPYQTFKATLTQTGHKTLLTPDLDGVKYLMGEGQDAPTSIRADFRANQQIAISSGVDDSGMFELNFNDGRYLPFEGTGAVSNWLLEMPKATNPIDFNTISDVIIHIRYAAKADGGLFKQNVMGLDAFKTYQGVRLINIAQECATDWHVFKNSATNTIKVPISAIAPPNVKLSPDEIVFQYLISESADGTFTDEKSKFDLVLPESIEQSPYLSLEIKKASQQKFLNTNPENLYALVSFTGQLIP